MALQLLAVQQRSSTRIRLKFDGAVAGSAFGPAALVGYTAAESYEGSAVAARTWAVTGSIAIASDAAAIELVLANPVGDGSWFWIVFNSPVPAAVGAPFAGPVSPTIRSLENAPRPSPEVPASGLDAILWGEDFVHDGRDWVETAEGDLLVSTGIENARQAVARRLLSEGLQWDAAYGLRPRRFVDAPSVTAKTILGEAQTQAVADDRVVAAASRVAAPDPQHPEEVAIETSLTFFSGQSQPVTTSLRA